jgi:cytochrome c peroxidase
MACHAASAPTEKKSAALLPACGMPGCRNFIFGTAGPIAWKSRCRAPCTIHTRWLIHPKTCCELDEISLGQIYLAIAAFESTLVSLNSRYDYYAHGVHEALSPGEIEGLNIFRSFVARCAECHTPPLFSNQQIAVLGTPEPDGRSLDPGREAVTGDASQRAGFKVPSLRNVALTAPYMHSGRYAELREAVAFYTGGRGHAVPEGENLSIHWHIWEPQLTDTELDRLVDFLGTLTDESYMPTIPQRLPSGLPLDVPAASQESLARQENQ